MSDNSEDVNLCVDCGSPACTCLSENIDGTKEHRCKSCYHAYMRDRYGVLVG